MYEPTLGDTDGITAALDSMSQYTLTDGLDLVWTDTNYWGFQALIPERLKAFLLDLCLLRKLPLSYLVPDEALLPPESIRFFHVDPTWVARVIDGVLSAGNTGSADLTFSLEMLWLVRKELDDELVQLATDQLEQLGGAATNWDPSEEPMTGMLIRSELARRWPDMVVEAFGPNDATKPMAVLRREPISEDLYIALFAGQPMKVHITEPFVGIRFGVELAGSPENPTYKVDGRQLNGKTTGASVPVIVDSHRKLGVETLFNQLGGVPRAVALHLEQRPYTQRFKTTHDEDTGSQPLAGSQIVLRGGGQRVASLASLAARQAALDELEKP